VQIATVWSHANAGQPSPSGEQAAPALGTIPGQGACGFSACVQLQTRVPRGSLAGQRAHGAPGAWFGMQLHGPHPQKASFPSGHWSDVSEQAAPLVTVAGQPGGEPAQYAGRLSVICQPDAVQVPPVRHVVSGALPHVQRGVPAGQELPGAGTFAGQATTAAPALPPPAA
jgi:hypothetical protein